MVGCFSFHAQQQEVDGGERAETQEPLFPQPIRSLHAPLRFSCQFVSSDSSVGSTSQPRFSPRLSGI